MRRRLFIVWVVTVALCAAAVFVGLVLPPLQARFLGVRVVTGLAAVSYVSAAAMCVLTFVWFHTAPRGVTQITVRELRRLAGYRR